jgi:hypothetical protein
MNDLCDKFYCAKQIAFPQITTKALCDEGSILSYLFLKHVDRGSVCAAVEPNYIRATGALVKYWKARWRPCVIFKIKSVAPYVKRKRGPIILRAITRMRYCRRPIQERMGKLCVKSRLFHSFILKQKETDIRFSIGFHLLIVSVIHTYIHIHH